MRQVAVTGESDQARAERFERLLKAIREPKVTGADFEEWAQLAAADVLDGLEAECPNCGTFAHEGPCVSDDPEDDPETDPQSDPEGER